MSLTDVMDDVDYTQRNFKENEAVTQHPLWMTETHYVYHLQRSADNGQFTFLTDTEGEPLCSPRPLRQLSMQPLVVRPSRMKILKGKVIGAELYPLLLTEAILQRSLQTVSYLVSTWPHPELHVREVLPSEDLERFQRLTEPLDTALSAGMSLCDAFMAGLLNLQREAKLSVINFTGIGNDRSLSRELLRLPILWIKPDHRDPDFIHSLLRQDVGISQEDVERYLQNISAIYSNVDRYVRHGHDLGPITVELDCHVTQDDAAIGLALQFKTPFTFRCARVWLNPARELSVPVTVLHSLLQPQHVTHLELEDPELCKDSDRWQAALGTLALLTSLRALSVPDTLHVDTLPQALHDLGSVVQGMRGLRRLNLACCTLRDNLGHLLNALPQGLQYLSLRDCRLSPADVQSLLEWPLVGELRELNLSRNILSSSVAAVKDLIVRMSGSIVCLSLSYSSLTPAQLLELAQAFAACRGLKVVGVQSFTPPMPAELSALLHSLALIPTLQRCLVFPESYAFPGKHSSQRQANRASVGLLCTELLSEVGRPDIQLE